MKVITILCLLALVSFGIFLVIFGEHDDSPGAQGLGVILAIAGAGAIYKQVKAK